MVGLTPAATAAPETRPLSECPSGDDVKAYRDQTPPRAHPGRKPWVRSITVTSCTREFSQVQKSAGELRTINLPLNKDLCNDQCGTTNYTPPPDETVAATTGEKFTEKTTWEVSASVGGEVEFGAGKLLTLIAAAKATVKADVGGKWASETSTEITLTSSGTYTVKGCNWDRRQMGAATVDGKAGSLTATMRYDYTGVCNICGVTWHDKLSNSRTISGNTKFVVGSMCTKSIGSGSCPPNDAVKPAFYTNAQLLQQCGWPAAPY